MSLRRRSVVLIIGLSVVYLAAFGQKKEGFKWPKGRKAAVSLTYDDGLDCHLDVVVPALDKYGLKGTFFCTGSSQSLANRVEDWRQIAVNGHELGNHTLFHPCIRDKEGRGLMEWVKPEYDLDQYTFPQLMAELRTANSLLGAIDGKYNRTFAYTCVDHSIQGVDFSDSIQHIFKAARADGPVPKSIDDVDVYLMPSYSTTESTGQQLIDQVKLAMANGTVAVFLFHSVGGGYLNVSKEAHEELLAFLKKNEEDLWVDTFLNVSSYVVNEKSKLNE